MTAGGGGKGWTSTVKLEDDCLAASSPQWFRLPCTVEVYSCIELDELYAVKKTRCKKLQNSRRRCGRSAPSAILTFFVSIENVNFKVP